MYDQTETPLFRRLLWIVLWLIVVVSVVWVAIWLLFFRGPQAAHVSTGTSSTQKHHSGPKSGDQGSSSGSSGQSTSGATNPSPTQLANAGAGNLLVPFSVAAAAGTTLYYLRLRKKLSTTKLS